MSLVICSTLDLQGLSNINAIHANVKRTLRKIHEQTGFVATIMYGGLIPRTGKVAAFA